MSAIDVHAVIDGAADAPVIVLSPSLGSTVDMWEPQVAELASRFRVVRYDHRGHGGSPVPPGDYEIADLFAFLTLDKHPSDRTAKRLPGVRQ